MKALLTGIFFLITFQAGSAGVTKGPEELGMNRAIVSDRAEVELLVDVLRGVAAGKREAGIVRQNIAPGFNISSALKAHQAVGGLGVITIDDESATVDFGNNGSLTFTRKGSGWMLTDGTAPALAVTSGEARPLTDGQSSGSTFIPTPVSSEHGINRLTRGTTKSMLDRSLLSAGGETASFYHVRYINSAPFVRATYIQFIVDREWNRILYGNLNHWIRAYDNILGPTAIATDPGGRLFVAESGNQRISVLGIAGEGSEAELFAHYAVGIDSEPGDIALSNNGTPLDVADDELYVIDVSHGTIQKYAVGTYEASLIATFAGFDNPSAIAAGTWNGANNGLLYVIDQTGKRLGVYEDLGTSLEPIAEVFGSAREYYQSIETDHFGNVYLADNVNGSLHKYTADLHYLASEEGSLESPGSVDIPFGLIEIEGGETYWAGFDQLFALERWADETGAQRRALGLALQNIRFIPDADISTVTSSFVLTDFGDVALRVYDESDNLVRTVHSGWMASGQKEILWDRRADDGRMVSPGTYRYEIEGTSAYREEATVSQTRFSLPMFYWQNCGTDNSIDDAMLVQGSAVSWGTDPSQTANEHATSVEYRFTGLNPDSEYGIAAEYAGYDGIVRLQDLAIDGAPAHEPVSVGSKSHLTGYIPVHTKAYADGELVVNINKRGDGTAIVSQLWLKETGAGFDPQAIDGTVPTAYALEQNYPNPFNPSTVIRYSLPVDGRVRLTVFDITGREIATLENGFKQAGTYEVQFGSRSGSGASLASGVYLYRVSAGPFSETRKMLLLK